MPVSAPLEGRRIIVTGGATGIGAAAVQVFAAAGASVAATYHRSAAPAHLTGRATWFRCDARDRAQVDDVFGRAADAMGGLDVLLHAAGLWLPSTPESITEEELDFLIATNVKATVFTNQAAYGLMRERGGAIFNLGSSEGVKGNPGAALYATTKSAVHAWTRSAAAAWGHHGITVNSLAPAMETPGAERMRAHIGPEAAAAHAEGLKARIPVKGALGDPVEDLGPVLVFLASPGAHFVTGQLLAVNGGSMMVGA